MLTIGRLASYAGVTIRAVRHYHQVGLLLEPERDSSGYRTYDAAAVLQTRVRDELGTPIVYVTHDRAEVALFADEVVVLGEGRVVQHATRAQWLDTAGTMTQGAS